jgi:nitrate reductase assembly molybdenum cofactor insertion protein NarJ
MDQQLMDYNKIADLFVFPSGEDYVDKVGTTQKYFDKVLSGAGKTLQPFTELVGSISRTELEDLYVRTFEVQSITTLDIGYIVFGDDYKRGELLVNLNREHKKYGIVCGSELADNLSNILKLLKVLEDRELRDDLVNKIIVPALVKMIDGFGEGQIIAKDKVYVKHHKTLIEKHQSFTIYKHPLLALYQALNHDFDIKIEEQPQRAGGFLSSIKQEITIDS